MEFVENVDKAEFNDFIENHPIKSHFLQSALWGELSKFRGMIPHYVGVLKNKQLIAGALLLEKKLPFGCGYFYAPRGFVLDYKDLDALRFMTNSVKDYVQRRKGIYFKIDPDIKLHTIDKDANVIEDGEDNYELVQYLKGLGFKHFGYNKNFEGSQPRYTFRINTSDDWQEIVGRFSTSTKQRIKKAVNYDVEVIIGKKEDLKTFYQLTMATEKRKNIFQHHYENYIRLYDIFSEKDNVKLFLGKAYPAKILQNLKQDYTKLHTELEKLHKKADNDNVKIRNSIEQIDKQIAKLEENIELFAEYAKKYPEGVTISAHLIVFYGDKGWVLYAGNHDNLTETFANYLVYQEHIKHAHERGTKIYDQFGTIGDLNPKNPLLGLHEFKKKFGGEYTEFVGEFTLITNIPVYYLFTLLVPFYRKVVKFLLRRRRRNDF